MSNTSPITIAPSRRSGHTAAPDHAATKDDATSSVRATVTIPPPTSTSDAARATASAPRTPDDGGDTGAGSPPLKIGVVAPPWYEIPPQGYGGTEAVVANLVDQLVARGHEVTLVASGREHTAATRFIRVYEEPPSHLLGSSPIPEVVAAAEAGAALADMDLDIVHDHSLAGPLLARQRAIPTVITMHGPATGENGEYFRSLRDTVGAIAISDAQRASNPQLNWVGRVHNAIDVQGWPFRAEKDDFLLWIGRYCPDKAPHLAIEAARAVGRKIVLAGKMNEPAEKAYFDSAIRPILGLDVETLGEIDMATKQDLYARAACVVFPIQWDEPFGMVMIEAMAAGTPVVATRRGSVPEVIDHGVSGMIVDRNDEIAGAIKRALDLDPEACRRHTLANFDLSVMGAGYEQVYRQVLASRAPYRSA